MATLTAVTGMTAVSDPVSASSTITGTADTLLRLVAYGLAESDEYIEVLFVTPAGNVPVVHLEEDRGAKPVRLTGRASSITMDGSFNYAFSKNKTRNAVTLYKVT